MEEEKNTGQDQYKQERNLEDLCSVHDSVIRVM
jgi:hypothetical protein